MNIAFENEMILVDQDNKVTNTIQWAPASQVIITHFRKKIPNILTQKCVIPELDACQIEITNNGPKKTLTEAQDEIITLFEMLQKFVREEYGLLFSQHVVPNQEYTPTSSGAYERYDTIMNGLLKLWPKYAKATNVAWLHLNFDTTLPHYVKINNALFTQLQNGIHTLGMDQKRFEKYNLTVEWVNRMFQTSLSSGLSYLENESIAQNKLFDKNGNPHFDYGLLRLKKTPHEILIGELRSFDAGTSISDLETKTKKAYDLILSLS